MADELALEIKSENDAWTFLSDAIEKRIDGSARPAFIWDGWPSLRIELKSTPIDGSISPSTMRAFLELQNSIYRSHTLLSSGRENLRSLSQLDKDRLEFRVRVDKGSSIYSIDLTGIAEKLGADVIGKMTGPELVVTVLGVSLIVASTVVITRFLDHRTDQRRIDSDDADTRVMLDSFKAQLDHDTKRYEMLTKAFSEQPLLRKIDEVTEPARDKIIEAIADERGGKIQGIELTPQIANEMAVHERESSAEANVSRIYRVAKVDTIVPDGFRVTLEDVKTGDHVSASLLDAMVSGEHRAALRDAEWKKETVKVSLKGRRLRGLIVDAKITSVEPAPKPKKS